MSDSNGFDPQIGKEPLADLGNESPPAVFHRLAAARRAKGLTRRAMAEKLGITLDELRQQEDATDLTLGTLRRWATALGVSVTELVVETEDVLPPTQLARAQAARLMKVAAKLRDRARRRGIQRLAQTFVEQLTEMLPSLEQIAARNHRGGRRSRRQSPSPQPRPLSERVFTKGRQPREE